MHGCARNKVQFVSSDQQLLRKKRCSSSWQFFALGYICNNVCLLLLDSKVYLIWIGNPSTTKSSIRSLEEIMHQQQQQQKNHVVSQWPQVTFCVSLSLEQHLSHHNCLRMFKVFPQRRGKNWYSGTALLSYIHNSIDIQMNEKHFPAFSSISAIHQVALPFFMLSSWHPLECGLCFIFHLRFSWKRVCLSTFSYGVA